MLIIGLHGKAQSGKDTVCGYIQEWGEKNQIRVERDGFADRLKISAAHALGVFENELAFCNDLKMFGSVSVDIDTGDGFYDETITGREYLQFFGTEAHRDVFDEQFWVNALFNASRKDCEVLVITDVRFPNEAEAIHERNGQIWRILRDGSGAGVHVSEQPLTEGVDLLMDNNGSLDGLQKSVYRAMNELRTAVYA